jgi:hypothetical protein
MFCLSASFGRSLGGHYTPGYWERTVKHVRAALLQLAHEHAEIRPVVVAVCKNADKWKSLPKGWTEDSVKKFWDSLTGDNKHKVTKCIKQMDGKVDDPGAFCASLADKVLGPEWRSKKGNGDMLQYYADNPDKLAEKQKRDKAKKKAKVASPEVRLAFLRARLATQEKYAADIRRILGPLFERLAPHVKNYDRFLKELASGISTEWDSVLDLSGDWTMTSHKALDWDSGYVEGKLLYRQTLESPAEYAEHEFSYPSEIEVTCSVLVPLRDFPRRMLKAYRNHVKDQKGFMQAVADLTGNSAAMMMLGKLFAAGTKSAFKADPQMFIQVSSIYDELYDWANEEAAGESGGVKVDWNTADKGWKMLKTWFKVTGQGIVVNAQFVVPGEAEAELDSDYGYDDYEPDYDDFDRYDSRYASSKTAVDIKRALDTVLQRFAPFVKDYNRFLKWFADDLRSGNPEFPKGYWNGSGFKTVSTGFVEADGGDDIGTDAAEFPDLVQFTVTNEIGREFPKKFLLAARSHVKDQKGFLQAVADMMGDTAAMTLFGKLLLAATKQGFTEDPAEWCRYVHELYDFVDAEIAASKPNDWMKAENWDTTNEGAKLLQSKFKITGQGLAFFLKVQVGGTAEGNFDLGMYHEQGY